jgi:hypothetical protein
MELFNQLSVCILTCEENLRHGDFLIFTFLDTIL